MSWKDNWEVVESGDGTYAVHWPTVYKIIESRVRAEKQNQHARLVRESQTGLHPLSWGLPDLVNLEVDWERVRKETRIVTDAEFAAMRWNAYSSMEDQIQKLREAIVLTQMEKQRFKVLLSHAQDQSMQAVERAVGRGQTAIDIAKVVRDSSATTLLIGATLLSGGAAGAAFATLATGSGLKATAKYQDTGNLGAASVELAGNLFFGLIPIGTGGQALQGTAKYVVLTMRSTWSSTVALVEGKSLAHALAVGGITFVSDPLAGAIVKMPVAKKMIERVAVPVTASTILRRTPADEVKTIVEKGVPAALRTGFAKGGAAALGAMNGPSSASGAGKVSARPVSPLIDNAILESELLLRFTIIDMERGSPLP